MEERGITIDGVVTIGSGVKTGAGIEMTVSIGAGADGATTGVTGRTGMTGCDARGRVSS